MIAWAGELRPDNPRPDNPSSRICEGRICEGLLYTESSYFPMGNSNRVHYIMIFVAIIQVLGIRYMNVYATVNG